MLTVKEIDVLLEVLESHQGYIDEATENARDAIAAKLIDAKREHEEIARVMQLARPEGTLIENISMEEAMQYSQKGEQLMLAAAQVSVPEYTHAKLASIMVGMVSAVCRVANLPRLLFCNDLMSNLLFTALKAAYNEGLCASGDDGEVDNGHT